MRFLLSISILSTLLFAQSERWFFDYELDAYYSNAGFYLGLDEQAIVDESEKSEFEIYRGLISRIYKPTVIVLEASINPLPIAGVAYKKRYRENYDSFDSGWNFNYIQAITEGFDDPYALSLFLGNVVTFKEDGVRESKNKGYAGLLISVGDKHIRDSELFDDDWIEAELKIKGDREFDTHILGWSFRIGAKYHANKMINNTWYLGTKRDFVDFVEITSWLNNSSFDYRVDFSQKTSEALKHYLLLEKNFPRKEYKIAYSLGVGFVWDSYKLYNDEIAEDADKNRFSFMIRPNIKF